MTRILVADDSLVTQLTLTHILEGEGYQVQTVNNGQEALDILRAQTVVLLISDISMPMLDGLALLQTVRQDAALRELRVILVTGTQEQLTRAHASSADAVLTKPVSSWQVLESVSYALEARQ